MRIVITGGSYSGKTTLICSLKRCGHMVVPEAGCEVISILNGILGVESQVRWRSTYPTSYQSLVWDKLIQNEEVFEDYPGHVFCDRGIFDGIAYANQYGYDLPEGYNEYLANNRYRIAFIMDTLKKFDQRLLTGRISDRVQSVLFGRALLEVYMEHDVKCVNVPEMPVQDRQDYVLEVLSKTSSTKSP